MFETIYHSMHRCGNLLLRDGKNLEKAQSVIQLAFICDPETVPGYKQPPSKTLNCAWIKNCLEKKTVQNAEDRRYECPVCNRTFARKKNQVKHTLTGTCGLQKY